MPSTDAAKNCRVAVITGGGRGIGRGITSRLVNDGWTTLIAGLDEADLKETKTSIDVRGNGVESVVCDIATDEGRSALRQAWQRSFDRLDLLVNCAAQTTPMPLFEQPAEDWRRELETNLVAAALLSSWAIEVMKPRRSGVVVNIGSIYGSCGLNGRFYEEEFSLSDPRGPVRIPAYHASKGGISALSRDLAVVAGQWNIRINAISPGMIKTPERNLTDDRIASFAEATPLRRMGRPEDIAGVVTFLASDDSTFITGVDLIVDGGWSVW